MDKWIVVDGQMDSGWMSKWMDRWIVGGWVDGKMTGWVGKCFIRIHILTTENGGKSSEVTVVTPPSSL